MRRLTAISCFVGFALVLLPDRGVPRAAIENTPRYRVETLFPESDKFIAGPIALNNRGHALVGGYHHGQHKLVTYLRDLGKIRMALSFSPGSQGGQVNDINDQDQIVGHDAVLGPVKGSYNVSENGVSKTVNYRPVHSQAVLWENGQRRLLGALTGHTDSQATGINNKGQIVGRSFLEGRAPEKQTNAPPDAGFLWEGGRMVKLGAFVPRDINERGQIIGYRDVNHRRSEALLWEKGRLTALGKLPACAYSQVCALNDRGQVVGMSIAEVRDGSVSGFHEKNHAFLWENGTMRPLNTLPGCVGGAAFGINNRGQVVGLVDIDNSVLVKGGRGIAIRAFLYEDGRMYDLNTLIPAGYPSKLVAAHAINERGEILAQDERSRAVLLIPTKAQHTSSR